MFELVHSIPSGRSACGRRLKSRKPLYRSRTNSARELFSGSRYRLPASKNKYLYGCVNKLFELLF